jgi:GNAT superfamily N-acetyltransferase
VSHLTALSELVPPILAPATATTGEGHILGNALRLERVRFSHPDARALVGEVQDHYAVIYGSPDETPLHAAIFDPPAGAFFVGYADDVPVAMGGWRLRSDVHPWGRRTAAEIKRMYVTPAARRRGYAVAVLRHLEETARRAGADVMVLETGTAQPDAIAMYEASGYELVDNFGYYAFSPSCRSFAKPL